MHPPVVIWAPIFWPSSQSAYQRDLQRAKKFWDGEHRIWMDPDADKVKLLSSELLGFHELVIPAETLNVIDVYHLDELGRVFPHNEMIMNWKGSLDRKLYPEFIRNLPTIYYQDADYKVIQWPVLHPDGKFEYQERKIIGRPASITPFVNLQDNRFEVRWGTERPQEMIHPQEELEEIYGSAELKRIQIDGKELQIVTSDKLPGLLALHTETQFDYPFDSLFPAGISVDHLYHHELMKKCIQNLTDGNREKALTEVERWVGAMSGKITARLLYSWYLPLLAWACKWASDEEILMAIETRYDIEASSINELLKDIHFQNIINTQIEIVWVDGWIGYMWWEILQDIEARTRIRFCRHCGNLLRGGRHFYCKRTENEKCFRERVAQRQRKHRQVN